jgi:dTDP-4-amino-4,6-dideoxygalactose transaminase
MSELAVKGGKPAVDGKLGIRWPVIGDPERQAALEVLDSGILNGPSAPQVKALEREFARVAGVRHCLATNSGTAALHLAVAAAGIAPGDEVITSAFTYPASALAILHHNAVPVFADIDPRTFNVDPAEIEKRLTDRTRAIMPVHIHGLPCDMDAINAIARRRGLVVIEDAAQAHGAAYRGRPAGSLGDMAGFSLNATKNLACGEGGLFVTDDDRWLAAAAPLRLHGIVGEEAPLDPTHPLDDDANSDFVTLGWMYLTQELPAAITRVQLRRLADSNGNAAANAQRLSARLTEHPGVTPPVCPSDRTHVYHKYRVRLDPAAMELDIPAARLRDRFLAALRAEGVEAGLWLTRPVPAMPFLERREGYGRGCPWDCHGSAVRYDGREYPRTEALLEGSIVIGSQSYPLYCQPRALMDQYADAFEKVLARVADLPDPGAR